MWITQIGRFQLVLVVPYFESYCPLLSSTIKLCSGLGTVLLVLCYSDSEDRVYKSEDMLRIDVCSLLSKKRCWCRRLVLPKWLTELYSQLFLLTKDYILLGVNTEVLGSFQINSPLRYWHFIKSLSLGVSVGPSRWCIHHTYFGQIRALGSQLKSIFPLYDKMLTIHMQYLRTFPNVCLKRLFCIVLL